MWLLRFLIEDFILRKDFLMIFPVLFDLFIGSLDFEDIFSQLFPGFTSIVYVVSTFIQGKWVCLLVPRVGFLSFIVFCYILVNLLTLSKERSLVYFHYYCSSQSKKKKELHTKNISWVKPRSDTNLGLQDFKYF